MTTPTLETVQTYYNERVEGKLRDFTQANPRIEAAIQTLAEWAPATPRRILEIGCGIGATSWRMARAWPEAEVIGADISAISIEIANACFQRPNLSFREGVIEADVIEGKFDLILMMDVYEHIALQDRPAIHAAIRSLLSEESRVIMTVPTPEILEYARVNDPSGLQPVDEDIMIDDIKSFVEETETDLLYYRKVGIWDYGDFAHLVFGRYRGLAKVALRQYIPEGVPRIKHRIKRLLGLGKMTDARYDYLGSDINRGSPRNNAKAFEVSIAKRKRLALSWIRLRKGQPSQSLPQSVS